MAFTRNKRQTTNRTYRTNRTNRTTTSKKSKDRTPSRSPPKSPSRSPPSYPALFSQSKTTRPGTDFYMFVNGNWLHQVKIPSYLSSYSVSDEIEDQVNLELFQILDTTREKRNSANTATYLLGTLTESALNTKVQFNNVNYVRNSIARLGCIRNIDELGSTLGSFIRCQINTPINFIIVPSIFQTQLYRLTITSGKLGLPDTSYYLEHSPSNTMALESYKQLLITLGSDFSIPDLEKIIVLEKEVARHLRESTYEEEVLLYGSEILSRYPFIPWKSILAEIVPWSIGKFKTTKLVVSSTYWLKAVNQWCKTFPLDVWKHWLSVNFLLHCLPLLPSPYDTMDYELFGHVLRGQSEKVPQRRVALHLAEKWLSVSLGQKFVQQYVNPSTKYHVLEIAKEIRHVAGTVVGNTEWLQPVTRQKAKTKVHGIYLSIGYPSKFKHDVRIKLHPEHLVENVMKLAESDFYYELQKANSLLKKEEWDDDVFAVNAYYYNEGNRLILPSGILRWPFYHNVASDGWNFGGLGATIGHELCHAFDDDGKEYDEHGKKQPWWSKEESNLYESKSKALIPLFHSTLYFGKAIDGELTLSENIADLAGLHISLQALKLRLERKKIGTETYRKELRDFFISYATSWRTKEKKQKALQASFMDVHAPPIARVNQIVSQIDDWYECFSIKPDDALYRAPEDRIRIF